MSEERTFRVDVDYERDLVFKVHFTLEGVADLIMDELEPVGEGTDPDASRLLAAAVGNCPSANLLFCLRKSKVEVSGMNTAVEGVSRARTEIFEQFCITSQSVKQGIPLNVNLRAN